jgi:hypothetical protein
MIRIYRACFIIVAALLLAGCGAINFAYNNAPSFVGNEFDNAFDLDDAQQTQLDAALLEFFTWHRKHELAFYRQFTDSAALAVADGLSANEVLALRAEFMLAVQRSVTRLIDDAGSITATLTPAQIDHYQQYFRDNAADHEDYLQMSLQQREIHRLERNMKRLQNWFGKFDDLQREKISLRLQRLPDLYPAWINYREARQQALLSALRDAATDGLSTRRLKFILLDPASDHARAYQPARNAYWKAYAQALEEITASLGKTQLEHAVSRLQNYSEIVTELMQDD